LIFILQKMGQHVLYNALFHNIIDLSPFYITLFWGLVLVFYPIKENRARFALGIFMLTGSVVYFSHAAYFENDYSLYMKIDSLYAFAGLSVYPMYYLYVRLLTRDVSFKCNYLWHLLPALLMSVLLTLFSVRATVAEKEVYLNMVLIGNQFPKESASQVVKMMATVYFASRMIFGIQALVYLVLGYKLVKKYDKRVANFYSNLAGKQLVWVELLTITLLVTAVASTIANLLGRNFFVENNLLIIPSALFSLLLFIIGLLGNKQNRSIKYLVEDEVEDEHLNGRVENKFVLKKKLLLLLENEQVYLDPNLRITTLDNKLYTNRTYLSNLINAEFKMSFSDFVNQYRVKHAKTLMESNPGHGHSLSYFSEQSGFGSVSSFNRAFKRFEGITAGKYYHKIERTVS